MYTFSPMMVANSRKHHCRVRSYTREVLVISTNLDIQKNHYPLDFRNRRGDEARIKNTWYNQGTDKAKIARKRSKPDKHEHGNERARKKPGESYQGYDSKNGPSRMLLKISSLSRLMILWIGNSLRNLLFILDSMKKMIKWIMVCVTTAKFSIYLNGERKGYFSSGKEAAKFKFHIGCKELRLTHLCFADDLLVVCHGSNSFRGVSFTRSDYFVIVRGVWLKSGIDLMIVVVYAPQEAKEKRMLWDYLAHVSNQWVGKLVMMGDFNEVRYKSDIYGSNFNAHDAEIFNSFIYNAGLDEVPLGGSAYTWYDYGPILSIYIVTGEVDGVAVFDEIVDKGDARMWWSITYEDSSKIHQTPFTYLGTKVGGNMSRKQAWKEVVDKVLSRLSRWKMKLLSIGGRLTLLNRSLMAMIEEYKAFGYLWEDGNLIKDVSGGVRTAGLR
ncbi:RNA-directed DNA polymerase, eukaryota [Tanacetum coccineum]